jgi:hypothetical protein
LLISKLNDSFSNTTKIRQLKGTLLVRQSTAPPPTY